jgi:hypothetical protein
MSTGLVLLLISLSLAAMTLGTWILQRRFEARAIEADALVVGHRYESRRDPPMDGDHGGNEGHVGAEEVARPVLRFRDAAGVARDAMSTVATAPGRYPVGMLLPILYDPKRPDMAQPRDALRAADLVRVLGGIALAGIAVAAVLLLLGV